MKITTAKHSPFSAQQVSINTISRLAFQAEVAVSNLLGTTLNSRQIESDLSI
jgi:hypothetical protein